MENPAPDVLRDMRDLYERVRRVTDTRGILNLLEKQLHLIDPIDNSFHLNGSGMGVYQAPLIECLPRYVSSDMQPARLPCVEGQREHEIRVHLDQQLQVLHQLGSTLGCGPNEKYFKWEAKHRVQMVHQQALLDAIERAKPDFRAPHQLTGLLDAKVAGFSTEDLFRPWKPPTGKNMAFKQVLLALRKDYDLSAWEAVFPPIPETSSVGPYKRIVPIGQLPVVFRYMPPEWHRFNNAVRICTGIHRILRAHWTETGMTPERQEQLVQLEENTHWLISVGLKYNRAEASMEDAAHADTCSILFELVAKQKQSIVELLGRIDRDNEESRARAQQQEIANLKRRLTVEYSEDSESRKKPCLRPSDFPLKK